MAQLADEGSAALFEEVLKAVKDSLAPTEKRPKVKGYPAQSQYPIPHVDEQQMPWVRFLIEFGIARLVGVKSEAAHVDVEVCRQAPKISDIPSGTYTTKLYHPVGYVVDVTAR
eukprot:TRINITY_DN5312_c0_g1_i1.p3 TRINITY_DN5312_c0_g1~~TRINITY_DN5312_c0_g1_i1.p3  ORF type:complete len:113 (+),score=19.14 TRINITY_DN5312_c0_g1_i1:448-786(+)